MDYKIEQSDIIYETIITKTSTSEVDIKINNDDKKITILNITNNKIEFLLDHHYHVVNYIQKSTSTMNIIFDGIPIKLIMHNHLNDIVYKNSGYDENALIQTNLLSQIPGKIISVDKKEGDDIKKDELVCVIESMKMQVSIKSHKDGVIKKIKIQTGTSVAKGDIIAEID